MAAHSAGWPRCFPPLGVYHARLRGGCLGLRHPNSGWTMPARAAVVSHLCIPAEMRPVDKSTSTRTTPLHMGRWDGHMPMPYRRPCPRHPALCYPTPCPCPCHPIQSPFRYLLARPALGRPAATLPGPRLGAGFTGCVWNTEHPVGLVVASVAVSSPVSQVPC